MKLSRSVFVFLWMLQSCSNNTNESPERKGELGDTVANQQQKENPISSNHIQNDSLTTVIDTLDNDESSFLLEISKENDFILLSNRVKRYYRRENLKVPVYNELIYSDHLLQQKGYVSMTLKFVGAISSVKISYSYSLGQASTGYGSIVGNGFNDYLHSFNSCGLTNCIVDVFKNRAKIFEKETPI